MWIYLIIHALIVKLIEVMMLLKGANVTNKSEAIKIFMKMWMHLVTQEGSLSFPGAMFLDVYEKERDI